MTWEEAIVLLKMMFAFWANTHERTNVDMEMALNLALSALRPVSRERIEKVWRGGWIAVREAGCDPIGGYKCSRCKAEAVLDCNDEFVLDNFCPRCGAAMTDEAVEITMKRLEELRDGSTTD